MTDHEMQKTITRTVDTCFSDLTGDPFLAQRIRNGGEGEIKVEKRVSFGLVLAIVLLLVTVAAAIAATQLGWVDFLGKGYNITVPKAAQEALNATKPLTFTVGPMTFTYNQLLTDKRIVLSAANIHMTDGSEVLYANDTNVGEAVDALSSTVLELYNLDSGISWLDAAKQLNLPLYGIRALIEIDPAFDGGQAMEDAMWNEDGSIAYFSMPFLASESVKTELPVTLYMAVTQFDPATGETAVKWEKREQITLPLVPMLSEKTYLPQGDDEIEGMKLVSIQAQQYATGIYLISTFTAKEGTKADSVVEAMYKLFLCDGEGKALPDGINMSGAGFTDELPTVRLEMMTSLDALPDSLIVTDGTVKISAK